MTAALAATNCGLAAWSCRGRLRLGWLAPGALASVETSRDERVEVAGLELLTERTHGQARLTLLRRPA